MNLDKNKINDIVEVSFGLLCFVGTLTAFCVVLVILKPGFAQFLLVPSIQFPLMPLA